MVEKFHSQVGSNLVRAHSHEGVKDLIIFGSCQTLKWIVIWNEIDRSIHKNK